MHLQRGHTLMKHNRGARVTIGVQKTMSFMRKKVDGLTYLFLLAIYQYKAYGIRVCREEPLICPLPRTRPNKCSTCINMSVLSLYRSNPWNGKVPCYNCECQVSFLNKEFTSNLGCRKQLNLLHRNI